MSDLSGRDEHSPALSTLPAALRRLVQRREQARSPGERCELCSEPLGPGHAHLLELASQQLLCACQACSLLFDQQGANAYKLVPRRYLALTDFRITDEQWEGLFLPVKIAFLFRSSGTRPVRAYYPGPAGATESLLDLAGWQALEDSNPLLRSLVPDVEALLINRVAGACESYLVPLDACYHLVGLFRQAWRGLGGGPAVWEAMRGFFEDLRARAQPLKGGEYARSQL